jgi:PIN domain nuclease of toxin-antitoxin system
LIVLDTHIWIWWVQGTRELTADLARKLTEHEESGLIVSAISLLEVSRAAALGGLRLPVDAREWLDIASRYPGISIAPLIPAIAVEA